MKNTLFIILIMLLFSASAFPQDQRSLQTKIADMMMNLPAGNSADHEKAMANLSALGESVILQAAGNLVPPGKGDDMVSRYVISGLAKYIAKGTDITLRKRFSLAFCQALAQATDEEVKDFLLQELQYVADDEAVASVNPLLMNNRLCDPAARVLIRINSELSNKALLEALTAVPAGQQAIIAEALGRVHYAPAAEKLRALTATGDTRLKKTVFRALAETGDPESAGLLASEAEKAGYTFEATDAAGSYFLLLKRLSENGKKDMSENSCIRLLGDLKTPFHAKSVALKILSESMKEKAVPWLLKALDSSDKAYRISAMNLLNNFYTSDLAATLIKKTKSVTDPGRKAELITFLGERKEKSASKLMKSLLRDKNQVVRLAAIPAFSRTVQAGAVDPLIAIMKKGDSVVITAARSAMLTIAGEIVVRSAASVLPKFSGTAKAALIDIIARRQADQYAELIYATASAQDPEVRVAAAKALQSVAHPGDEGRIASLLSKAMSEEETTALQEALYLDLKNSQGNGAMLESAVGLMNKAGEKRRLYFLVLARIGGDEALKIVTGEFEKGDDTTQEAALKAIAGWNDQSALGALYRISAQTKQGKYHDIALESYINGINRSKNTTDQKVLMFRKAMDLAVNTGQKKLILQGISRNSTLLSLLFVSRWLDDAALQQTAVQAVRNTVLNNNRLTGKTVEDIVNKAILLNKDPEADYQKQALLKYLAGLPQGKGYFPMFNGRDLTGWKGLVENPVARAKMTPQELAEKQKAADEIMRRDWKAENGVLVFEGKGYDNLCSEKMYEDFELILDWRMQAKGDGGVYLRGSPQVQTWDTSRVEAGAQVGSGGLYNNKINPGKPLLVADNPINEWNTFRITMIGEKVTVYLNGQLVVDNVTLENYWDRKIPIFDRESIELQAHGTRLEFRDIYIREIPRPKPYKVNPEEEKEGFVTLFNGLDMTGWQGNLTDYFAKEGEMVCDPARKGSGNIYTARQYNNFILRFEFQLTPGANNGLGIRTPLTGDAAYVGMELQILDNEAEIYKKLQPYQYHGSVYGVIPAKRGFQKPVGEWNVQEVQAIGNRIKVTLNGEVILDGDIAKASKNGKEPADHKNHPGLMNPTGYIGFLGHGSPLKFRNLRIKEM